MFRRRKHGSHRDEREVPGYVDEIGAHRDEVVEGKSSRPSGPFDDAEIDIDEVKRTHIDLGGVLVPAVQGMKVQLQLDKRNNVGTTALLRVEKAAVQLIAVAAPRTSGMWDQTRLQIIDDAKRRGGQAEEANGPFGTEVRAVVPITMPDGKQGKQPSRVSGIDGPRWMLRATFLGAATSDVAVLQRMVDIVRQVVVVRGDRPMPPGDVVPLKPPAPGTPGAEETDADAGVTGQTPES